MSRAIALLLAGLALLAPARATAGGFTITIIGGRRTGMATNIARPDDLTALFHNPAGLADQPGVRLHLSTSLTFLSTEFKLQQLDPDRFPEIDPDEWPVDSEGYYAEEITPEKYFGVLPYLGGSTDLGFLGREDMVVSLAVYSPDFYGAFLPEEAPTAYHIIEGTFMVIATTAGWGWRINNYISVGASVSYHYMQLGYAQKFSTKDVVWERPEDEGLASAGQLLLGDLRLDYTGRDHGLGWGLGVLVDPTSWLTIGMSYNGATAARFEGDVKLRALARRFDQEQDPYAATESVFNTFGYKVPRRLTVEMVIPHAVMFGLNFKVADWLEIGVDYRLWLYTLYKTQDLIPRYDPDDDPKLEEPMTAESLSRDKNYNLSFEASLGFLVRPISTFRDFEVMLGTFYDQSPIPDETFTLDNPSLSQTGVAVGARVLAWNHWRFALTYMMLYYLPRDVRTSRTSPPTNARGTGLAHLPGFEVEYIF